MTQKYIIQMSGVQGCGKTTLAKALTAHPSLLSFGAVTYIESPVREFFRKRDLTEQLMAELSLKARREIQLDNLKNAAGYYTGAIRYAPDGLIIMDRCPEAFIAYTRHYGGVNFTFEMFQDFVDLFPRANVTLNFPSPSWTVEDGYRKVSALKENEVLKETQTFLDYRSKIFSISQLYLRDSRRFIEETLSLIGDQFSALDTKVVR